MKYEEFWQKMYRNLRTKREYETLRRNTLFSAQSENSSINIKPKKSTPKEAEKTASSLLLMPHIFIFVTINSVKP